MPFKGQVIAPIRDPLKSAEKLAVLIRKVESVRLENATRAVVEQIITTALGLSKREVKNLSIDQLQIASGDVLLSLTKEDVHLPPELGPYGHRLMQYLRVTTQP